MGTQLSSDLGKMNSGEEEEWRPTSVTPLPDTGWLFNSHIPDSQLGHGTTHTFLLKSAFSFVAW